MTEEKNIDTEKKDNQPQDKFADELLTDEQLDKVAGGHVMDWTIKDGGPSGK